MIYAVYIVQCADRTLYTGIATDVARRLAEHNGAGVRGARYTSARRPVALVYMAEFENRSTACKEEARIKRLSRTEKLELIAAGAKATQTLTQANLIQANLIQANLTQANKTGANKTEANKTEANKTVEAMPVPTAST
jgi:putative endonuclease